MHAVEMMKHGAAALFAPLIPPTRFAPRWADIAPDMAEYFTEVMRRNNPGWKGSLNNESPTLRFIAAVIPEITGETPTVTAISQFFKRRSRKEKDRDNADGTCS